MSGLGLDLIDPKIVAENERAPAQPSEFVRGARAGTYGMGSSLRNAIGAAADAFDFDNFAAQQFGEADRLSLRAQQTGPRVGSLEQLGREGYSLRNVGDFTAGVMGGAAPSIGLGLGASLATGGALAPAMLAGTAAFTPFEAGDAVAKWRAANPGQQIDGQTGLRLAGTGVGSAAFQSMVPAMVGGKIMGRGMASAPATSLRQAVGRNLAEIPMEGFTEGAGELIKQTGATPDAPTDWGQVGENAVAGMIGGAPMAGLGAGGDYLHGNAQAIGGAVDKGVGAVRGAADRAAGAVTGAARGAADATAPVVRDAWDGVADMAKAAYDGTVEGFKASDLGKTLGERAATVRTWAKEIIDDPATPEGIREGLRSAVAGAGNKANQAYAWAAKQARDAQTAAQEKGVKSAAADALRKLREKTDDTVDRVLNDDFLGDAATMAKATGDRVTELSQESGRKAAEFATKWGNELLDRAGVSEETKAQVAEALRNVGDRASQVTIATAKKAADATEGARTRAKAFVDGISKGMKEGAKDGTKKSEDYSGARQAVNDVLTKYRSEIPAAAFEDPETASMLAEGLRQFVQIAAEPGRYDTIDKHWVRAQLGSLLGPRSTDILNDVFDAVGSSDPDAVARRYEVLNDLDEMNKSSADLTGVLQAALPEGSPLVARQAEDADVLTRWARGELTKGMPEAQAKFEDRRMQEYIQETYGDKAEVVLAALEGHAKQGRDMQHQRATADELEGEIDEFDGSTSEREDEGPDVRYIGLGAGKRLVTNPEVYRAQDKTGKPGSGDDLLEKLKERYPQADIRFVSVVEKPELIEMIPSVKGEMTKLKRKLAEQFPNDPDRQAQELEQARLAKIDELRVSGKGMFEVVNNPNEYRFTQPDIEAMRLDTERFGRKDHPSRLEVPDGPIFDAVRVAKTMMRKINRNRDWAIEDDRSDGHRLARAFSDGVAALMEEYGRFKVSPDTLIGTVNGKPFYARDIKKLKKDSGENFSESDNRRPEHIRRKATADDAKSADELQAELDALALTIEAMELEDGDPQTLDRLYGREAKLTERLERVSMEENAEDTVEELGQQTADHENDNIVKAGAALREGDLQRKAQAGTANAKVPNAKPLIALAEKIRDSNAPAREKIADRLQTLALNIAMLSRKDQERLLDLKMAKKVSEVSGTINDLARKYADQIVAPKDAPPDYTPKPKAGERTEAQDRAKIINEVRRGKNTNVTEQRALLRELEAQEARGEPMGRFATEALAKLREEGPSDPKAAAAKKAAFLKKAASGDAALIKELKASNDAKGLQRAVEALNAAELTDANEANIIAAVEAINDRLSELVRDPDVAYGMGTKKYSLVGARPEPRYLVMVGEGDEGWVIKNSLTGEGLSVGGIGEDEVTGAYKTREAAEAAVNAEAAADPNFMNWGEGHGILGHEYAASNGRDSKTPNYVIYDDSKIETNYVHFSAQKAAGAGMSQKGQRQILDAIRTMLGNSVKVMFKNLPHAGEFERVGVDDVIRISVHALNPTTVAYHESLHAFFAKLMREGNGDIADVLMRATKRPAVAARLRELLAGEPAALKQLRDPEERAAYMFQFWANGDAKLAAALKGEPQNLLQRIAATLRKVLGIWSNEERALHIMEAFSSGEYAQNLGTPNAFHRAMMEPGRNKAIEAARSLTKPLAELGDVMVAAGSARLRESRIPSLVELADVVKAPLTEETGDPGFVPAARLERTRVLNALGAKLAGLSRDDVDAVRDILQTGNNQGTTPEARLTVREVRKVLADQLAYLRTAGVDVKDLGPDYFPRVYDATYISKHQDEFRAVLDKYGIQGDTMHKIIANGGTEMGVEVDRPGMQAKKRRSLGIIPDAELAPFMQKDLYQILNSYVTQSTRRAEWARRFGDDSARLHTLLAQAKKEGATPAQIEAAEKYVKGVNGTLGDDINPTARRLMGDMIVYQNIRLLPLAIFSSVVDPMGVLVRGGEVKDAWSTFKRGIREIPKGLRGDTSLDESARIADALGVIDNAALVHDLGALYSQGMVGDTARKVNDTFFRFNLMEQFNRSMRVGATEAALKFMERHSGGNASTHSARWMRELGLMRGDVQVVNGRVALTQADGLTAAQEARIRTAVNRWVDGAVLRPDAADKPIWMNDPHWALVAHLKQFVYAFHHTILKRVGHEMRNGNYAPAMALASYVPIMIAADVAKGMLQNGGDEPEWKKNWGLEDYVAHGVQRAGLLGVGQLGADAYTDVQRGGTGVGALVGPTFEQMGDALQVMGGHKQFGSFALRAMPANALYSGYLDEGRTDLSTD